MAAIEPKTVTLKNGKKVCLRTPIEEDAKKALNYLAEIFQDDHFFHTTAEEAKECWSEEKTKERFLSLYDNPSGLILVTETEDGVIISMSNVECSPKKRTSHVCEVGISILPDYRELGLGTIIMETMIEWAQNNPAIEKLRLGAWASNQRALALYEKMGFVEEGRKIKEVKYVDGTYDDCILMYRFVPG
ncbi:MAG: GNAT family N-acetyltransferase [Planctomycetota bacterium]|jgi:RimJ/RimL family protein N-acetyltransferase